MEDWRPEQQRPSTAPGLSTRRTVSKKKKKIVGDALYVGLNVLDVYLTRRREARLTDSLQRMSGVVAEVEALYQRRFAQTNKPSGTAPYDEGWCDGVDSVLADLDLILHPQGQDDVYHLFDPDATGTSDGDCPDFVEKDGDRG